MSVQRGVEQVKSDLMPRRPESPDRTSDRGDQQQRPKLVLQKHLLEELQEFLLLAMQQNTSSINYSLLNLNRARHKMVPSHPQIAVKHPSICRSHVVWFKVQRFVCM